MKTYYLLHNPPLIATLFDLTLFAFERSQLLTDLSEFDESTSTSSFQVVTDRLI